MLHTERFQVVPVGVGECGGVSEGVATLTIVKEAIFS